jgi:hypothetical protein
MATISQTIDARTRVLARNQLPLLGLGVWQAHDGPYYRKRRALGTREQPPRLDYAETVLIHSGYPVVSELRRVPGRVMGGGGI